MHTTLVVRVETESHSIYQMRTLVETGQCTLVRVPGPDAAGLIDEPATVISYMPIREGNPFAVTIRDPWDGESRTLVSTPVKTVQVWLV